MDGFKIAPAEANKPIPLFLDPDAEILSFPTIYGGEDRKLKMHLSYTDIAKSELRRPDRRACTAIKVLYNFKKSFNEKIRDAVQVCLRKMQGSNKLTAQKARDSAYVSSLISRDEGYGPQCWVGTDKDNYFCKVDMYFC